MDAADGAAPVDGVEVGFEDLVFGEAVFDAPGDGDFEELAVDLFPERGDFAVFFELEDV